ncbi:hypothetical protein BREVNS_1411 [Brevinematales bacterium NS]|nr:hypothetical protein BREVNS_1411 [Brevinematales bacterium NS]
MYSRTDYILTEEVLNKYGFAFIERKDVSGNVEDIEGFSEKEYVDIYKTYTYGHISGMYKFVIYVYYIEIDGVLYQKLEKAIEIYKVDIKNYTQSLYHKDVFNSFEDYFINNRDYFIGYVFNVFGKHTIFIGDYCFLSHKYEFGGYYLLFFTPIYAKYYFDTYLLGYIPFYKKTRFIIMEAIDTWSFVVDIDEFDRLYNERYISTYFYRPSAVEHLVNTEDFTDLSKVFYFFNKAIERYLKKNGKEEDYNKYFANINYEEALPEEIFSVSKK